MLAPWPATGPTLALFQLFLGPANATCSGHLLLGILDPADELVAGQRRDVPPGIECCRVGDQRAAQICGKSVHHPAGHSLAAHRCQRYGETTQPMSQSHPGVRPATTRLLSAPVAAGSGVGSLQPPPPQPRRQPPDQPAMHIAAITQTRMPGPEQDYYWRKRNRDRCACGRRQLRSGNYRGPVGHAVTSTRCSPSRDRAAPGSYGWTPRYRRHSLCAHRSFLN